MCCTVAVSRSTQLKSATRQCCASVVRRARLGSIRTCAREEHHFRGILQSRVEIHQLRQSGAGVARERQRGVLDADIMAQHGLMLGLPANTRQRSRITSVCRAPRPCVPGQCRWLSWG